MPGMVLRRLGRCDVHADAVADAGTGRLHGIVRQMRVTRGRLYLCVTKKLTDHRKALAECQGLGRKAVAQVMNSHIVEAGPAADAAPGVLEVGKVSAGLLADDDPRIVVWAGKDRENGHRGAGKGTIRAPVLESLREGLIKLCLP